MPSKTGTSIGASATETDLRDQVRDKAVPNHCGTSGRPQVTQLRSRWAQMMKKGFLRTGDQVRWTEQGGICHWKRRGETVTLLGYEDPDTQGNTKEADGSQG